MEFNKEEALKFYLDQQKEKNIALAARMYCECEGIEYKDSYRVKLSRFIRSKEDITDSPFTPTSQKTEHAIKETSDFSMPSAWDQDLNKFLTIDEYCVKYNLDKSSIAKWKLVSHNASHMVFNIEFKDQQISDPSLSQEDYASVIDKVIDSYDALELDIKPVEPSDQDSWIKASFTDTHIGMDPNRDGNSLYGGVWNKEEVQKRFSIFAKSIIESANEGVNLVVDDYGDYADGLGARTARGGHDLPQNMTDVEVYELGVKLKVDLCDRLVASGKFSKILFNFQCNSNHGGDFDYFINYAVSRILESRYPNIVECVNHRKFISHYFIGDHCFIISHGKDDRNLRFSFPVSPTPAHVEKINDYILEHDIYQKSKYIHFCKGDSHQFVFDYTSSDKFDYFNYPAISPSSTWVQANFKKGRSGFVIETFNSKKEEISVNPKFFKWST